MNENNNILDIETELNDAIAKAEPSLQDAIKRGLTNTMMQMRRNNEKEAPINLEDMFFSADDTNVTLTNLKIKNPPLFHIQSVSLDLHSLYLTLKGSIGDVIVEGHYHASNDHLYNIIPVSSSGHIMITMSNVEALGEIGLKIVDDSFDFLSPGFNLVFTDVRLKVSWPTPTPSGGYEFITSEKIGHTLDDVPAARAISRQLSRILKRELSNQIRPALQNTTCISEILGGSPELIIAYRSLADELCRSANKAVDLILMNVRMSLLKNQREIVKLPHLNANFSKKVGAVSIVGQFSTDYGWLRNLASINRINNANLKSGLTKSTFCVCLSLQYLKVGFDEYKIKFMGAGPKGRMEVTLAENSIYLAVTAGITKWKTYAKIEEFRIEYFEGFDIHITGLGPFNWLISKISTWLFGYIQIIALPFVEERIKEEIQKALEAVSIWEIMKGKIPTVN